MTKNGLKDASKDPDVISEWFQKNPHANVGIVTGAISGFIAVDNDPRHGGDESIAALEKRYGAPPATQRFLTGGSGEHILFRHPGGTIPNSTSKIAPGIDIKADGGYIVAPPSQHISGKHYAISVDHHPDDVPLADAPAWLLDLIQQPAHDDKTRSPVTGKRNIEKLLEKTCPAGQWDNNATLAIAAAIGQGWTDEQILLAFKAYLRDGHTLDEVREKIRYARTPQRLDRPDPGQEQNCSATEWPNPLNLFPDALETPPQYSPEDYPEIIANLADDISRRMGVDPVIVAWTAIAVVTALINDAITLQVKANDTEWRESARLWIAFVGSPSSKKSPGMNAVLKPINQLQAKYHKEYMAKREVWKRQVAAAKKEKMAEPDPPQPRKIFVNDTTLEALCNILEHNDGGILAVHDELSGWFGSMDCYRQKGGMSKDRSAFLTAYNGGPLFIDRVGHGPRYIKNFSLGIIGGIQPDPMRRIASSFSDDDGLLQRFIPLPVRPATTGADVAPDDDAWEAWEMLCGTLADMEVLND